LLATERGRIEKGYVRMSHIYFKTIWQPDYEKDPEGVRAKAKGKAQAAWLRLKKGEDFAKVVEEVSEDDSSRSMGGRLSPKARGFLGVDVDKVMDQLKPGEYSAPVESPIGIHVIRRDHMEDQKILDILKDAYKEKKREEIYTALDEQVKVEKF
jgi:peptidyl-prolyl cis-trans isomerase SurA